MLPYSFLNQELTNRLAVYHGDQSQMKIRIVVDFLQTIPHEVLVCGYNRLEFEICQLSDITDITVTNTIEALSLLTGTFLYNSIGRFNLFDNCEDQRRIVALCSAIPKNMHYILVMYCIDMKDSLKEVIRSFFETDAEVVIIGDNFTETVDESLEIVRSLGCNYSKGVFLAHRCRFRLYCQIAILCYQHDISALKSFVDSRCTKLSTRSTKDFIGDCRRVLNNLQIFIEGERYDQLSQLLKR